MVMEWNNEKEAFNESRAFCHEEEAQKFLKYMAGKERFEIRELTRDELLQMRWQMYKKEAERLEQHWRNLGLMSDAMFGIVYSLHEHLKKMQSEDVERSFMEHKSIKSHVKDFSRRESCVQLIAEFTQEGKIVLHEWTWDGPDHIEDTKTIVRNFDSFTELLDWARNWETAEEDCLSALLKAWKKNYLDYYMTLPHEEKA